MHVVSFPGSVSYCLNLALRRRWMEEVLCTETWTEFLTLVLQTNHKEVTLYDDIMHVCMLCMYTTPC